MNDTKKAKEIARDTLYVVDVGYSYTPSIVENMCLQMAAWKDEQIISWLENNASNYVVCNDFAEFSHYATKTMIEDLKKYMEK